MNARENGRRTEHRRTQNAISKKPILEAFKTLRDDEGNREVIAPDSKTKLLSTSPDPYLLWAQNTGFARVGSIMGSRDRLVQVAVELYGDVKLEEVDKLAAARSKQFCALADKLNMRLRSIYLRGAGEDKRLERYFTATIPTKRLDEFILASAKGGVCERYELGHPLVQSREKRQSVEVTNKHGAKRAEMVPPEDKLVTGKVIAVIDYGCPFAHEAFRTGDSTRVRYLWLQDTRAVVQNATQTLPRVRTLNGKRTSFPYGWELRPSLIDKIVAANTTRRGVDEDACYEMIGYDLMLQATTHGAHVLSIAAGKFNPLCADDKVLTEDEASTASIIFVQLPRRAVADASGGSMNCHVIDALRYILERTHKDAEVVVNMSFGTHAGPHDGTSILECAIDDLIGQRETGKFQVVIPAGNSFNAACHARLELAKDKSDELLWEIMPDDPTDSFLEIWYGGKDKQADGVLVQVQQPGGGGYLPPVALNVTASWLGDRNGNEPACTIVHVAGSAKKDGYKNRVALIALAPARNNADNQAEARYGVWKVKVTNTGAVPVTAHAWIERDDPILDLGGSTRQSRFVVAHQDNPERDYEDRAVTKFCTLNSYATAQNVQVVGGAVKPNERVAEFGKSSQFFAPIDRAAHYSSAGPAREAAGVPAIDWVAYSEESDVLPGINAAGTRSRYWVRRDGTSAAAPQVARALVNNSTLQTAAAAAVLPSVTSKTRDGETFNPTDTLLQTHRMDGSPLIRW